MNEVKRWYIGVYDGNAQARATSCSEFEIIHEGRGELFVRASDFDAQRLRADTAEAESEDLRRRVTNVNSQLIAANWELSETREAYLNQSGRLVAAEQRISGLSADNQQLRKLLEQTLAALNPTAKLSKSIRAALNQKSEGESQ